MTSTVPIDNVRVRALTLDPAILDHSWVERAACAEATPADDHLYFPELGVPPQYALALCEGCPVAAECLATGLFYDADDGLRFGWWGGVSPDEREDLLVSLETLGDASPQQVASMPSAATARQLRAQNFTITAIASTLGCTERSVYRYLAASAA